MNSIASVLLILIVAHIVLPKIANASGSENKIKEGKTMDTLHDPQKDFDFLIGTWKVQNRKLKERLKGSNEWEEFEGRAVARSIWGGKANTDEYEAASPSGHIQGMTLRLFNPASKQWSIYWANSKNGTLDVPVIGEFKNGIGEFYNQEFYEGRAIYVRYIWSAKTKNSCRWEQAFSPDGGKTWETNWIMDFTRVE